MVNCIRFSEFEILKANFKNVFDIFKNKSFLISGATGLIGTYIVEFLDFLNSSASLNMKIDLISHNYKDACSKFYNISNLNIISYDLSDNFDLIPTKNNYDYIISAASNSHPIAYSTDPVGTIKLNLLGNLALLNIAKCNPNSRFILLSTFEIYGPKKEGYLTEEDWGSIDTKKARSCYPESKRLAETLCYSFARQFGTDITIARLGNIYGPTYQANNSRADAQFFNNGLNGKEIILKSKGTQLRSYCYVADTISGILYILSKSPKFETYNLADMFSIIPIKKFAELVAQKCNVNLSFELPNKIEKEGYSPEINVRLSTQKLNALGWHTCFAIDQGIENTIAQLRYLWPNGDDDREHVITK